MSVFGSELSKIKAVLTERKKTIHGRNNFWKRWVLSFKCRCEGVTEIPGLPQGGWIFNWY